MKLLSLVMVLALAMAHPHADAARLGGGKSVGQQSSNVTQRQAATGNPSAPSNASQPAASGQKSGTPAPQPKRFGGLLAGLAAGLGLAWLAHSLGLGAEFGQFLMLALLALGIMAAIGWVMRSRRNQAAAGGAGYGGLAYSSAAPNAAQAPIPKQYSPMNVGNDASARPWEAASFQPDVSPSTAAGGGSIIGSALAGNQQWGVPADFDTAGFLTSAKRNFMTLQVAWDRSDIATLRSMMTDAMLSEIQTQLAEREVHRGSQPNQTDVVMLEAQLLGIEDVGNAYLASVEFSGMIREEPSAGPSPFREVWNMTKPTNGSTGWLVAGVQALQ